MELLAIELRHLRYFIVLAEELNYRRAAERLHVSTPALSIQIKKLEQILNVRLLERDTTKVFLTAPGETLLHKACELMRHAQEAVDITKQVAQGQHEHLSVGVPEFIHFRHLSDAINTYRRNMPEVNVTLMDFATLEEQHAALEKDRLHVGFLEEPHLRRMKDIEHAQMFNLPVCVLMKEQHPLTRLEQITLADVAQYPLHATKSFTGQEEGVLGLFEAAKIKPPAISTACRTNTLFAKLAVGQGVSLLLQERLHAHLHGLTLRPVKGTRVRVHAIWKIANETPRLLAFLDQLRATSALHEQGHSTPPFARSAPPFANDPGGNGKRPLAAIFNRHRR